MRAVIVSDIIKSTSFSVEQLMTIQEELQRFLVKIKAAYQEILGTTDMHELFKREYEKYVAEIRNRKK